jgi:tetratricopeptide (TPR) repeat protein
MTAAEIDAMLTEVRRGNHNERDEARALFQRGQRELHHWAVGTPGNDHFDRAFESLHEAAGIYERLDSIELLPVLITIAEACAAIGESASAVLLYQRVLVDARKSAWQAHGAEHADGLCARACFGLGEHAYAERRHDDARAHFERALALTTRHALDATRRELLEELADAFARCLGDELQARRIRKAL